MKNKSIKKNALLNVIKTISSVVFPMITFPYISRVLSVDSVGAFNFSASIINYCLLFAGLGVSNYAIREGSQYRGDKQKMSEFISDVFTLNMIATIIVYIALFIMVFFVPRIKQNSIAIFLMSLEIVFATLGVNWVCNIYEDFYYIAVRTIVFQVVSLISIFIFVRTKNDYYQYVIISVIASSGANILNFFYIRSKYVGFRFRIQQTIREHIKPILVIFASTITITLYVNSDIIILGFLTDDYRVGLYSTAVKIYTVVKNLIVALLAVLVPRFSILFTQGKRKEAEVFLTNVVHTILVILIPVTVGLFVTCNDVILLLASGKYADAGKSLRILSVGILFSIFAYLCTNCVLLPNKKENVVLYASIVSAIVNVVFNFILIPILDINAAALTTVIAEGIMCLACIITSLKIVQIRILDRDTVSVFCSCIGIVMVCFLARSIKNDFLRVFVEITVSMIIYFLMLLVFKNSIVSSYKEKIRASLKR